MEYTPISIQQLPEKTTNQIDLSSALLMLSEISTMDVLSSYTVSYLDVITSLAFQDGPKDNRYNLVYFPSNFVLDGINDVLNFLDQEGNITNTDLFLSTRPETVDIQITDVTNFNLFLCNVLPVDNTFTVTTVNLIPPVLDLINVINLNRAVKVNISFIQGTDNMVIPLYEAFEIYIGTQRVDLIDSTYSVFGNFFTLELIINGAGIDTEASFQYVNNTNKLLAGITQNLQEQIDALSPGPPVSPIFTNELIIIPDQIDSSINLWDVTNYGARDSTLDIDYTVTPKNSYNIFFVNTGSNLTTISFYGFGSIPIDETVYLEVQLSQQTGNVNPIFGNVLFQFFSEAFVAPINPLEYSFSLDPGTAYRDFITLKFTINSTNVNFSDNPNEVDDKISDLQTAVDELIDQGTGGNPIVTVNISLSNGSVPTFNPALNTDYIVNVTITPLNYSTGTLGNFLTFTGNIAVNKANLQVGKYINILFLINYTGLPFFKGSFLRGLTIDHYYSVDVNFNSTVYSLFRCDKNSLLKTTEEILFRNTLSDYHSYMMSFARACNRSANTSTLKIGYYKNFYDGSLTNSVSYTAYSAAVVHPDILISSIRSSDNTKEVGLVPYGANDVFQTKNWFISQVLTPTINSPITITTAYTAGIPAYFNPSLNTNIAGNFIAAWVIPYYIPFQGYYGGDVPNFAEYLRQTSYQSYQNQKFVVGNTGGSPRPGVLIEAYVIGYHATLGYVSFYIREDQIIAFNNITGTGVTNINIGFLGVQKVWLPGPTGVYNTQYLFIGTSTYNGTMLSLSVPNGKTNPPINYSNYVFTIPNVLTVGTDMTNFMTSLYLGTGTLPTGKTVPLNYNGVLFGSFDGLWATNPGGPTDSTTLTGLIQCINTPYNSALSTTNFQYPVISPGTLQSFGNTPY